MVAGAGSQVDVQAFGEAEEDILVGASVDVGLGELIHAGGLIDESVSVVLYFLRGGGGTALFLCQGVFVGVLRRISVHQGTESRSSIARVFVPFVVGVQARADQGLEELVGGGVGPLLTCECEHAGDQCGGV